VNRKATFTSLGLGVVWFVLIEIIMINHQEPIWGLFSLICIAAMSGLAAMYYVRDQKIILLMLPLPIFMLIVILIGNPQIIYVPVASILAFYCAQYLVSKKMHNALVLVLFVLLSYVISFLIFPVYLLKSQTIEARSQENINFFYKSNLGNSFTIPGDRPIILEFWNKGCSNCFKKMYMLEELKAEIGDKCDILCVYVDYQEGVDDHFSEYEQSLLWLDGRYNLDYTYDSLYYRYDKKLGLPQTMIISPKGEVLYNDAGYLKGNKKKIMDIYKSILQESS